MLEPINKNNIGCVKSVNDFSHLKTKPIDFSVELLKNSFELNPCYNDVYTNYNTSKVYKTWIYEGNDKDKIVGYKYLQSYPYDDIKFEIGDYVHWKYGGVDTIWLLISLDKQNLFDIKGRMMLCNNTLDFIDNDIEYNIPCVVEDSISYTNFKYGNSGVVEQGSDIVVLVKKNDTTKKIKVNDRFLFNDRAFRIKQFLNEVNPNYLEIYMSKVSELQGDGVISNIAINDNKEIVIKENNIVIEPNLNEILEGETKMFTVTQYEDGISNTDGFSIVSLNNIPSEYYALTQIDDNSFSIYNIKQFLSNPLSVKIINNNTNEEIIKEYWLGGNW